MANRYSNASGVPLSVAVFLATDHYDYDDRPNAISVTTLIKPLRQIILASRIPEDQKSVDLISMVKSRMGTAIHTGIETAWLHHRDTALEALGYPKSVIDRIVINPPAPEQVADDAIVIYMEQRYERRIGKWIVTGKPDFIAEGRVEDFKSTSTFAATSGNKDADYILQGSMYRWLKPEIITQDTMAIQWIFTDWSAGKVKQDPKYPATPIKQHALNLMGIAETDAWIKRKLDLIDKYWDADEDQIPECSDEELWRSAPVYKWYKGGDITAARSTKNFDDEHEARVYVANQGGIGILHTVPGQVTACKYCPAFLICGQKDLLVRDGQLIL